MSMSPRPKNARELALRVLQHPRGGLEALLALAKSSEPEWLELKAASFPEEGQFAKGTNEHDYRWNVAKAVIALANSIGGVVLLGVDDEGRPVGIEASDPKHKRERDGAEAFRRDVILQQVLLPKRGWKTGRHGTLSLINLPLFERLVSLEEIRCGEKTVLAILVDPVPRGYGYVEVEKGVGTETAAVLTYIRSRGDVGQVVELPTGELAARTAHDDQRTQNASEIGLIWDRFLGSAGPARPVQELVPDIRRFIAQVIDKSSPCEDVYTPLNVEQRKWVHSRPDNRKGGIETKFAENWLRENDPSSVAGDEEARELLISEHVPRQGLVTDLLGEERQALLIGEGGSGKSRCFAKLVFDEAKLWAPGRSWPLYASLSAYSESGLAGLLQAQSEIEWQDLAPLVAAGEVSLYLDGLNECPDLFYQNCCTEIASLLREYLGARVFVSTRSANVPDNLQLATFEMRPMERQQQCSFLQAYLRDDGQAEEVLDKLHRQPGAKTISGSPILLRIVSEVARAGSDIPAGRAALYRRFLETSYRREVETAKGSGAEFPWSLEQVTDALSELAFRTRQKGISTFSTDRARDILIRIVGENVDRFIDWMTQGTFLVSSGATGVISFWHETMQEYLCAEHLAACHEDLAPEALAGRAGRRPGTWAMSVAFALELIEEPSKALIDAAWQVEPLIVAAATRDTRHLKTVQIEGDTWTRGVLRALRGEDTSEEAREITIVARLPPKYPISDYLVSTLRSSSFWYAARIHETGTARLDRLRNLICGRQFPWIELLPSALAGNIEWGADLSPALRALVGVSPAPLLSEVLATVTVSELCALRRQKRISAKTFLSQWERALDRSTRAQLQLDLVDILRSERSKVDEVVRKLLKRHGAALRSIANEQDLSLRLLNILVRNAVVEPFEVRNEHGRLDSILSRMSIMNAVRLAKTGVIQRGDLDEDMRARLVFDKQTRRQQLRDALNAGLISDEDLPEDLMKQIRPKTVEVTKDKSARDSRFRYQVADIADDKTRAEVDSRLRNERWLVTLGRIHPRGEFGFAKHSEFDSDIFCWLANITSPEGLPVAAGQTLDVRLVTRFDRKSSEWKFAVKSGRIVK
jgi:hypothetical protein